MIIAGRVWPFRSWRALQQLNGGDDHAAERDHAAEEADGKARFESGEAGIEARIEARFEAVEIGFRGQARADGSRGLRVRFRLLRFDSGLPELARAGERIEIGFGVGHDHAATLTRRGAPRKRGLLSVAVPADATAARLSGAATRRA